MSVDFQRTAGQDNTVLCSKDLIYTVALWISVFPKCKSWTLLGFFTELIRFSSCNFVGSLGLWFFSLALFFHPAVSQGSWVMCRCIQTRHGNRQVYHRQVCHILRTGDWIFLLTNLRCGRKQSTVRAVIIARKQGEHLSSVTEQKFGSTFPAFVFFPGCLFLRDSQDRKLVS